MLDTNVFFQSIHLRMAKLIKLYNLLRIRFACKNPSIYGMHPPTHTHTYSACVLHTHTTQLQILVHFPRKRRFKDKLFWDTHNIQEVI